jgi:hypothetical protein
MTMSTFAIKGTSRSSHCNSRKDDSLLMIFKCLHHSSDSYDDLGKRLMLQS